MSVLGKHVVVVAYAFEPHKTSEPGVGWNFTHEIAKFMRVTVLTRSNNREAIEAELDCDNIEVLYFDLSERIMEWKKKIPFGIQIYYSLWQRGAYKMLRTKLQTGELKADVLHHLTFGMTKNVPPLGKIEVPFIWGPIGGGDIIPFSFLKEMGLKASIQEIAYRFIHWSSNLSLRSFRTRKNAKAIVFRTQSSLMNLPQNGCENRFLISETAMPGMVEDCRSREIRDELICVCVGRIMHGKGYMYALKGFHQFLQKGGAGRLIFVGEGPEKHSLIKYVAKYKLQDRVDFKGFIPNKEVKNLLNRSHVLLHPSFREGGSWSIMEGMSFGLPVICLKTSGPQDMVTDQCGVMVEMKSPKQVTVDIAEALLKMVDSPETYSSLSKNAVQRIKSEYNWAKRGEQIKKVYQNLS